MNSKTFIENGFVGVFVLWRLSEKYLPYLALIAGAVWVVYAWPDSKIIVYLVGGVFGLTAALVLLVVAVGTVAKAFGYYPEMGGLISDDE